MGGGVVEDRSVAAIEAAMVAVRRRQSRRVLARAAGASGVDIAAQEVLDAVDAAGGAVGVTGIAEALDVDQPRASKLVAAAVRAGLLRREADQADGRRSVLALTAAGRDRLDRMHAFRRGRFAAAMDDWTDAERAAFADLLTRFVAGLDD
jgi:DNA-binding MarR family transcriptional regulator